MRFHCVITLYDFATIDEGHYLCIRWHKDKYVLLSLYLDDILIVKYDFEFVQIITTGEESYIIRGKIHKYEFKKLVAFSHVRYIKKY